MTQMRSILLLEDQPDMQAWMRKALAQAFPQARQHSAALISQALALLPGNRFDLALLDLGLPDGSGLEVLSAIRQAQPQCLAVVVTSFSDDDHLFQALRQGAQGYVVKDAGMAGVAQGLLDIAEGRPPLSAAIARRILSSFIVPQPSGLSARQREMLALIGKGYSTAECAELLQISVHTAHGYVKEIYRILDIHTRAEAASEAVRLGLVRLE